MSLTEALDLVKSWIQSGSDLLSGYDKTRRSVQTLALLFGLLTARSVILRLRRRVFRYPPGPIGVPLLGCLASYGGTPKKFLTDIAVNYGAIVSVPLSQQHNIFINDAALAKDVLRRKELSAHWESHNSLRPVDGFDLLNGQEWQQRRRHLQSTLLTIVNSDRVLQSMNACVDGYFGSNGTSDGTNGTNGSKPSKVTRIDGREIAAYLSFNTLFSATFGVTLGVKDEFIKDYVAAAFAKFESVGLVLLLDFSFKTKLPDWLMWGVLSDHRQNEKRLDDVLTKWMQSNGYDVDVEKNIIRYRNVGSAGDGQNQELTVMKSYLEQLEAGTMTAAKIMSDLSVIFAAGIDTTSNTSHYGFVLLAKHPKVQQMVFEEMESVLRENAATAGTAATGGDAGELQFSFKVINKMHLFRAFIHEVLRISCVAGSGVPHQMKEDLVIEHDGKEYVLPKHSIIHYNTFFIMKKKRWHGDKAVLPGEEENNEIRLDYWLRTNKTGKKEFYLNDEFVLFGHGKRDCVGQGFAKRALYALFGIMMTKFKFVPTNGKPEDIRVEQEWGLTQKIGNEIDISIEPRQ